MVRLRIGTMAGGLAFVSAWLTREETLFWIGLSITVLQLIYDFYKTYTANNSSFFAVEFS